MLAQFAAPARLRLSAWLPVAIGLLAVYLPSFLDLAGSIWQSDRNAHGPIVLAVALWYLWFRVRQLVQQGELHYRPAPVLGWCLLALAMGCYVLGRSQEIWVLEVGSLIPSLAGCVALFYGFRTLRRIWFALFFLLFVIPLPASMVDAMTQPMKIGVSYVTEHVLYWLGYPVARSGVILMVGQYQLLVADACAGLHSLFTLEALGLLYINVIGHQTVSRNIALATLIVPISFTSNVLRVIVLALITYHLGDEAGQGFLHGFAGMMLFLFALMLIIGVDSVLGWVWFDRKKPQGSQQPMAAAPRAVTVSPVGGHWRDRLTHWGASQAGRALSIDTRSAWMVGGLMLLALGGAVALRPEMRAVPTVPDFAQLIPRQFGEWREVPSPFIQIGVATEADDPSMDQPYDAVLMRTYANARGEQIMLALAYGAAQRQDVKIHRPEVCYEAQGYVIEGRQPAQFQLASSGLPVIGSEMVARNRGRVEAVSYWIRIGGTYAQSGSQARWHIFREGLQGRVPDGMLVRASSIRSDAAQLGGAYRAQEQFLGDLVRALPQDVARLLVATTG